MSHQPIRVLVLIKGLNRGGAERLVASCLAARDREDFHYEVAYVMSALDGLVEDLRALGVAVHCLDARGNGDLRWLPRLRRLLRAGEFDIVHSHLSYAAIGARLVTRTMGRRAPVLVYTEHSVREHLAWPIRLLAWLTIPADARIFAVASSNAARLPRSARRRAQVLLHGLALDDILRSPDAIAAERTRLLPDGGILVATVANLRPQKAYPTLLHAVRRAMDDGLDITVVAAGDGPLRAELEALRDALGLGERFRFLGFHPDTVLLIHASDIVVLASDYEAMPVAIMEAMSVGRPIVATTVGDIPQAVTDGRTGLLVQPGDPVALALALGRAARDPALRDRLGSAARERSRQFDIRRTTATLEDAYRALATR